ncbi:hypothetical protein MAPG_10128 [Magnaporthiopsis poae ATCC 64411]|uniref:Uncharacterized protein n=1 Tax=Magnaporthiopsis poae (strain ATCC 64411 / 73-15) TaxID=644358 RepID=A0A0C4EBS3_MAGP6|nr:hypothetical protein MAPG_10128 [Magnaporthiopsis poae ATCC 64411]
MRHRVTSNNQAAAPPPSKRLCDVAWRAACGVGPACGRRWRDELRKDEIRDQERPSLDCITGCTPPIHGRELPFRPVWFLLSQLVGDKARLGRKKQSRAPFRGKDLGGPMCHLSKPPPFFYAARLPGAAPLRFVGAWFPANPGRPRYAGCPPAVCLLSARARHVPGLEPVAGVVQLAGAE